MELKIHTPLSVAVIAGRTAWQSFHKGGNYKNHTDNITEDDYNFLSRLFNKFKHLSVAEHLKYHIIMTAEEFKEIEHLDEGYLLKEVKVIDDGNTLEKEYHIVIDMRFILENKDDDSINSIIKVLPPNHFRLVKNAPYENSLILENDFIGFEGKNVDLIFHLDTGLSEHLEFVTIRIKDISRAMLQELVRHDDFLSPTIKSTRYTLKELKGEDPFVIQVPVDHNMVKKLEYDFDRASKYVKLTDNDMVNKVIVSHLDDLRILINSSIGNDITKYALPEAYLTEGIFTLPIRNLKNMVKLRDSKDALWEFQEVAKELKELLNFLKK